MDRGRSVEERLVDRLLLLYLAGKANQEGYLGAEIRVQKMVYLSETAMQQERIKGFNYGFIRFYHGPFSSELRKDLNLLEKDGFLYRKKRRKSYFVADQALQLMNFSKEILERNTQVLSHIDKVIGDWASVDTDDLLPSVYSQKALYHPEKIIEKLALLTVLLKRIPIQQADRSFQIASGEAATLEILFDPEALASLERAQESARTEPSEPWAG